MKQREESMINKKYLTEYSEIMLKSLDSFSEDTALIVSDLLTSDESLLKIKKMLEKNPNEQEFLKMLEKAFPGLTEANS